MPWQVGDVVNHVIQRTQNRLPNDVNLRREFFLGLDKFCRLKRFWFRKKRFVLPLLVGIPSYDFSAIAPDFCGQIEEVLLIGADGISVQCMLDPIVSPEGEIAAVLNTLPDTPRGYLIDITTSLFTLRLQAPSNVAQSTLITYWASPMVTDVDGTETIPLIPQDLHYGLFDMLEMRAYEILYGQNDPRWAMAKGKYEEFKLEASKINHWSNRKAREMSADDLATTSTVGYRHTR